MKLLTSMALICCIFSAEASTLEINGPLDQEFFNSEVNENKSYFEVLGDMYKAGTLPSLSKLVNVAWSGRCFLPNAGNTPGNGGHVIRLSMSDAGPISTKRYQRMNYSAPDLKPANFFDDKSISQIMDPTFWKSHGFTVSASDIEKAFYDLRIGTDAIVGHYFRMTSSLKLSGKFLVEEVISHLGNFHPTGKGYVAQRCYYFLPE